MEFPISPHLQLPDIDNFRESQYHPVIWIQHDRVSDADPLYHTCLTIGAQTFKFHTGTNLERAVWYGEQLYNALQNLTLK